MTNIITRTAIAAAAATALAAPSFAATDFAFEFEYDRGAVETSEGAQTVYADLEQEVAAHCEVDTFANRILNSVNTQRCIDATMDKAVSKIDSAAMNAVHDSAQG